MTEEERRAMQRRRAMERGKYRNPTFGYKLLKECSTMLEILNMSNDDLKHEKIVGSLLDEMNYFFDTPEYWQNTGDGKKPKKSKTKHNPRLFGPGE